MKERSSDELFQAAAVACGGSIVPGDRWSLVPQMVRWLQSRGTLRIECLANYADASRSTQASLAHRRDKGLDIDTACWADDIPEALANLTVIAHAVGAAIEP